MSSIAEMLLDFKVQGQQNVVQATRTMENLNRELDRNREAIGLSDKEYTEFKKKVDQQRAAMNNYRRSLMQTSISLFVLNISTNQMLSSLKPLVKGSEAATQAIQDFQAILNLALGPMQFFLALLQIQAATMISVAQSATIMGAAMGAAFFFLLAFRQESPAIRAALGAVSGAMAAMAIISAKTALANTVLAGSISMIESALGGPIGLAIGLAALGAAVATVTGYLASAQTVPGQMKRIKKTGVAEVHAGEVLTRPMAGGVTGAIGSGGDTYVLNFPPGTRATEDEAKRFANTFRREVQKGNLRKTSRRVAVG